jgi:hypothetical protein
MADCDGGVGDDRWVFLHDKCQRCASGARQWRRVCVEQFSSTSDSRAEAGRIEFACLRWIKSAEWKRQLRVTRHHK